MKAKITLITLGLHWHWRMHRQSAAERSSRGETVTITHSLGTVEVPVNPSGW